MATTVVIAGTTYNIADQGLSPPWGQDQHDLLVAITTQLNSIVGSSDIGLTTFTIANNTSSVANVTGLSFDTSTVRSAIAQYSIYRNSSTTETSECGQIYATYKSVAGTWEIAQSYTGSSGVVFSITSAGQIQYTSTNFSGISYTGTMKFTGKSFLQ